MKILLSSSNSSYGADTVTGDTINAIEISLTFKNGMIEVTTPSIPFSVMSNLPLHEVLKLGMVLESSRTERSGKTNKSLKNSLLINFLTY